MLPGAGGSTRDAIVFVGNYYAAYEGGEIPLAPVEDVVEAIEVLADTWVLPAAHVIDIARLSVEQHVAMQPVAV